MYLEGKSLDQLLHEAGGHRVQRIPPTERRGRVHSSTVTVAVMEKGHIDPEYFKRKPDDFEISFFSGTGPGGQNRNKVQACARIKHLPTGITRSAQTRSRENSVRLAMEAILKDLDQAAHSDQKNQEKQDRQQQVGSGMRADKRRTYRFQDDKVFDHETGQQHLLSRVMKGDFERLWPKQAN